MSLGVESTKLAVNLSYDVDAAEGELARVFCENTETGGVSNGNWGKNDGFAVITYPQGYEGVTKVTIQGNHGGTDSGTIEIADGQAVVVVEGASPEHPIELPGDLPEGPFDPDAHPEHPIVLPPDGFWGPTDPRPGQLPA